MLSLNMLVRLGARPQLCTMIATLALLPDVSQAALPTLQDPSRGQGSTWLELFKNYFFDFIMLAGLGLCALGLLLVARHGMTVYHEIHIGKKTWPDLFATGAVGIVLVCLTIFLVTKATGIM
ncbi:TIGR03745 family integrating conjugative element membrane protein [uncultured Pseudomonas sp.]|uniref:TIGR03745 family integrating conjugative element membrane protein n=1 Tax=uncultured Pseudomonas sp. TaxID=114707 RepID=UPI0025891446|nr:TIGR03745 family integrating conjugative element membrane protein [uncultured Pseudomonas sp.]